ncbi:TetR/AcrR family transcriptional regulator [Nocardia goodfellowii]|uniref:AcrR family transcriptional regulator n=1 Tax=Nocardia goodfellowii TaxID=882446 RepID=A0ABS4QMJ1_9NOCA|nr:TetR/AcrR family transcriptional regulator [Nocardia goodfellowii]MBP2192921.1 AcrR family transcriptional regulator [Nocardia goodfellowii]
MQSAGDAQITDKRLLRGAKTRQLVLRQAVDLASLEGLGGLSFGRLATDTGLSKAGIQTLFRTKEALQLATIDQARRLFIDAVIRPAGPKPHGLPRLREIVERWIVYSATPLFAGGCFWTATLAEFDSVPGPIRDALVAAKGEWLAALADELRHAAAAGEIGALDADLVAFQIDAVLSSANTAMRCGDPAAVDRIRRSVESFLA